MSNIKKNNNNNKIIKKKKIKKKNEIKLTIIFPGLLLLNGIVPDNKQ